LTRLYVRLNGLWRETESVRIRLEDMLSSGRGCRRGGVGVRWFGLVAWCLLVEGLRFVGVVCRVETFFVGWWVLGVRVGWSLLVMDWKSLKKDSGL
jgi:hypothetical protein